jgi:hypothetical protein
MIVFACPFPDVHRILTLLSVISHHFSLAKKYLDANFYFILNRIKNRVIGSASAGKFTPFVHWDCIPAGRMGKRCEILLAKIIFNQKYFYIFARNYKYIKLIN